MKLIYSIFCKLCFEFPVLNKGGSEIDVSKIPEHLQKDLGVDGF
ncbi:hypothetical protein [Vibrio algivorus]|uniref:Uncharacterized protein n=1 Tax=Vibrio algivorus TaxID=1667024 RepID=A0ABQ6ES26_9VIBR|nr:hypothetical protein [Vibrio algivorus]GLT15372.1 hypothetical protein GCM10007931_23470 [Vibrio algivorus]